MAAFIEEDDVGGKGGEDRWGLDKGGWVPDWLVVNGSPEDGSGAGCGAMRANEEGRIRRRAVGFYLAS